MSKDTERFDNLIDTTNTQTYVSAKVDSSSLIFGPIIQKYYNK